MDSEPRASQNHHDWWFCRFSNFWAEVKIYIQKWILNREQVKIIMVDDSADFRIFSWNPRFVFKNGFWVTCKSKSSWLMIPPIFENLVGSQDLHSKMDSEPPASQNHHDWWFRRFSNFWPETRFGFKNRFWAENKSKSSWLMIPPILEFSVGIQDLQSKMDSESPASQNHDYM